ncbi:hypothetical protein [Streptomyces sp. NPDC057302]|uniref:hypothetical protein n=1 Tax=Streptomyces sp. NPDC057302 TaxID=3346094 RepID=UPI00363B8009
MLALRLLCIASYAKSAAHPEALPGSPLDPRVIRDEKAARQTARRDVPGPGVALGECLVLPGAVEQHQDLPEELIFGFLWIHDDLSLLRIRAEERGIYTDGQTVDSAAR